MLETARLRLMPPQLDDLAFVSEAMNTPGMMRHLGGKIRSVEAVADDLSGDIAAFAGGHFLRFTIWLREPARRIGRVGLFTVRAQAAPATLRGQREIGWMVAEQCQGQGYASEAARAAIAFAFADPALTTLFAQTSDSNAASTRLMARLGFARRADLDYVDPDYPAADNPTTIYALERGKWASRHDGDRD